MSFESHPVLRDYAYYTIIWEPWSKKIMSSKPSVFSLSSQNLQKCVHWTNLCNHLPGSGSVLARLDAKVPPPLEDEDNRLSWDVEAGGPTHPQLTRGEFLKGQFLPWLQRSTWKTNIFRLSQPILIPSAPVLNALSRLIMSRGIPFGKPGQWGQRVPCVEHKKFSSRVLATKKQKHDFVNETFLFIASFWAYSIYILVIHMYMPL